jgi:ribose 5-phosphate isomerase B
MGNDERTVVIACDHAGYDMKEFIKKELGGLGVPVEDLGAHSFDPADDYPVLVARAAESVSRGAFKRGIAICGAGVGASITANKFKGVRAALCVTTHMAELARKHNDSNMLVLGGRITTREEAARILRVWLETEFEGGRHARRVRQLNDLG